MEIAGYDIDEKYLIAGAAGLGIIFLLTRGKGDDDDSPTAFLQPAEGLNWGDVLGSRDDSALIGPGGPGGTPGPPGPPGGGPSVCRNNGETCSASSPCCSGSTCTNGVCVTPQTNEPRCSQNSDCPDGKRCENGRCKKRNNNRPGNDKGDGGGGRDCQNNNDCSGDKRCRNGRCEKRDNRDNDRVNVDPKSGDGRDRNKDKDRDRDRNPDRPRMRGRNKDDKDIRLDNPRDAKRRDEGNNRINDREPDRERDRDRERNRARGGRARTGDIEGNIDIDVSGGTERRRGKNARANARGGKVKTGDIGRNSSGSINASGGRARADASGGDGNRTGRDAKQAARRLRRGRGGEASVLDEGFGRLDGKSGTADGIIRTHIQPGSITGSFMPVPQGLNSSNTATLRKGESLRGLAKRVYGNGDMFQRIVELNNTYEWNNKRLEAGTVFKIG